MIKKVFRDLCVAVILLSDLITPKEGAQKSEPVTQQNISLISSQNEFFTKTNESDFLLTGFYHSKRCPNCEEKLSKLFNAFSKLEIVRTHQISLMLVDLFAVPFLKEHYSFEFDNNLIFFVRNQLNIFKEANELVLKSVDSENDERILLEKSQSFVTKRIAQIVNHVFRMTNFNNILKDKKIIGLLIGGTEQELVQFVKFALLHPDFNFYYIFEKSLIDELFKVYQKTRSSNSSIFAIARDQSLIDEFDTDPFIITDGLNDRQTLNRFFDSERYPKFRHENLVHSTTFNLFANQDKILLYVGYDSSKTKNFEEFKKAVKVLPKRLTYTYTFANTQGMGYYMHLFMMAGMTVTVETVYLVHILKSRNIEVITMSKSLTKANIVNFVFEFYENQKVSLKEESSSEFEEIALKAQGSIKSSDL
jgi:hypothetical protein